VANLSLPAVLPRRIRSTVAASRDEEIEQIGEQRRQKKSRPGAKSAEAA